MLIHQNFPGQFRHLALHYANQPEHQIIAIGRQGCPGLPGVRTLTYQLHRQPVKGSHHYLRTFESGVLHGQAVVRLLLQLKQHGFLPDVIVAHPGRGESLFVKEVFPESKLIHFCEWYYHPSGVDAGFDPEFPLSLDDQARIRTRNAMHLLNLEQCDVAVAPTHWQKQVHPASYHNKIQVIHEGIDTALLGPNPQAEFTLPNGHTIRTGDPVVTYVARNLEPYRGFHVFMRTLPALLAAHPTCQVMIVGGDSVSYGSKPKHATGWKEALLQEVSIDPNRVHFLGKIPYDRYRLLLQISAAHVYLTYPFVLSWSLLEAMATGCLVIGSDTPPVREVIQHGVNGLLVPFFDQARLVRTLQHALSHPMDYQALRNAAWQQAQGYARERGLATYATLFGAS